MAALALPVLKEVSLVFVCVSVCVCVCESAVTVVANGNVLSWLKTPLKVSESYVLPNGCHSPKRKWAAG